MNTKQTNKQKSSEYKLEVRCIIFYYYLPKTDTHKGKKHCSTLLLLGKSLKSVNQIIQQNKEGLRYAMNVV